MKYLGVQLDKGSSWNILERCQTRFSMLKIIGEGKVSNSIGRAIYVLNIFGCLILPQNLTVIEFAWAVPMLQQLDNMSHHFKATLNSDNKLRMHSNCEMLMPSRTITVASNNAVISHRHCNLFSQLQQFLQQYGHRFSLTTSLWRMKAVNV